MNVPFVDLRRQGLEMIEDFDRAFRSIVERAAYTLGPELAQFEESFAAACGCEHAIGVSSGTDALKLAYRAVGVGPGDEVIVPVNTFIATAEAVSHLGAVPVFVDCRPDTANIDASKLSGALTPRTRAIVAVHLYGQPADMDAVVAFARQHGLAVIEDACQAHGASYKGRKAGSIGDAAAFSFYPGKNLGALGDGGAVTTNDSGIAAQIRLLRDHGQSDKYTHAVIGYCDRLHNMQAAFLALKLPKLADANDARRRAAARYDALLAGADGIELTASRNDVDHVHHLYVVRVRDREHAKRVMDAEGIGTGVHYPVPLHLTPAYRELGYGRGDFPVAERLADHILSLPMHPYLTDQQIDRVAAVLAGAVSEVATPVAS